MGFLGFILIALAMAFASGARAETYTVNGKPANKTEAMLSMLQDKSAQVLRCQEMELTDKATIRVKKVRKVK